MTIAQADKMIELLTVIAERTAPISTSNSTSSPNITDLTAVEIVEPNAGRSGVVITNDFGSAGLVYIKHGSSASSSSYAVILTQGGTYQVPDSYKGTVTCIAESGKTATVKVTKPS
jgi:hypothetical protein